MPENKTVYFRIGSDKAGTVTLGQLAQVNKDVFAKHGFYAPMRNCLPFIEHIVNKLELQNLGFFTRKPGKSQDQVNELVEKKQAGEQNIFLTTETLWGRLVRRDIGDFAADVTALLEGIKDFFSDYRIVLILNLRRADLYCESLYKQAIKSGRVVTIDKMIDKEEAKTENYSKLLGELERVFGKENIIIRPFERAQMKDGDFVADTLDILGLLPHIKEFEISTGNEGLHRDLVETLIVMNESHGKKLHNMSLLKLSKTIGEMDGFADVKSVLSTKQREDLVGLFSEFYDYVSKNYHDGKPFFITPFPDDQHLEYKLPPERLEMISKMILDYDESKD